MISRFKKLYGIKVLIPIILMTIPSFAIAGGASQSFIPEDGNIFISSDSRGKFTCARLNEEQSWLVGFIDKKTGIFKSAMKIVNEKKKLLKKTTNSNKRKKLEKDIVKKRTAHKTGAPICKSGPGGSLPQATPTPGGPNPTPTRTPTPTTSNTCFNGDLSKPGCFGLPSGASGNKRSGATYWENNCDGCHLSKSNINYSQLLNAFNKPEMLGFKPDNQQDIYDLVAWLNRFTL